MGDTDGFRVNLSGKEASAKGRSTELVPRGDYHMKVTEGSVEYCGPESKNPGEPYYKLECTFQGGRYAGRSIITNAMLFDGALYTVVQIAKAMGQEVPTEGDWDPPQLVDIIGTDFICGVKITPKKGDYDEKNDIASFMAYDRTRATELAAKQSKTEKVGAGKSSLMP
jgi:hypothetical protein